MKENNNAKKSSENLIFHIALNPDGTLQPIINVALPFGDIELLKLLLCTDRPGGKSYDLDNGTGYLFMFDNNRTKPYPSVMIWKYRLKDGNSIIEDVGEEDLRIIPFAVDNFLR